MKNRTIIAVVASVLLAGPAVPVAAQDTQPATMPAAAEMTEEQQVSYIMGSQMGRSFAQQNVEVDVEAFVMGMNTALAGEELAFTDEEMRQIMEAFQKDLQERVNARMQQQAEENLAEAEAFLEENKEREGVQVLEPGLQYMVMEEGEGESPPADATVTAHYSGTLLDGTEFDSSYDRGEPLQIAANQVIQGWTKALTNMKPGSKWKVWIHPDLAYGEQGRPTIPPNSLLVFEMELLSYE